MDITHRQLEIFHGVVVAGSITKASQRIGLSQPSISQQLAKLEETLDVQLIKRNRTGCVALTPAGEFWLKHAQDILGRMAAAVNEHEERFKQANIVLRLGTTPALRGRFTAAAARIALQERGFVKFELVYDLNSTALVERLRMHQLNFAIVAEASITRERASFVTVRLFDDHFAWAVPASVPEDAIRYALLPDADPRKIDPVLRRYVEIDAAVPTRPDSDGWYRHFLPSATPVFGAPTFHASIEFVAADLATCHVPLSLLPNLTPGVRRRLRFYEIDGMSRRAVLAMRKHLLTHGAYARIFHGLAAFCRTEYEGEMRVDELSSMAWLLPAAEAAEAAE